VTSRSPQLPERRRPAPLAMPGDYHHLEQVVVVNYPVRAARLYLNRHMSNPVNYKLVEARRGERLGHVREIQINPAAGTDPIFILQHRTLPDGTPANAFTPPALIRYQATIETPDDRKPPALVPEDEIILHVPVRGYLRFLPAVYQGAVAAERRDRVRAEEVVERGWRKLDNSQSAAKNVGDENTDAMRRFLFVFQHLMTTMLDKIEQLPDLTNPLTTDPRFLPWVASWVQFTLDESLPMHQQRELVRRAIRLYRKRGTRAGVEEIVRVLTGAPARVQPRARPRPFVLGGATLAGGRTVSQRYQKNEPLPFYLYDYARPEISFFALVLERRERFSRRFSERAPDVLRRLAQIVTAEKPAHITFTIRFEEED
jgi:phage tail-like protein